MIILGIDPGPKESAYVTWDGTTVLTHKTGMNDDILADLLYDLPGMQVTCIVAIEWIVGYGMTVGSETFDTCFWAGRFAQAAGGARLIPRRAIKLALCGNTTAKDQHIRQALVDRIGAPGNKKQPGPTYGISGHEWAALAVAVVAWDDKKEKRHEPA